MVTVTLEAEPYVIGARVEVIYYPDLPTALIDLATRTMAGWRSIHILIGGEEL